MKQKLNFIYFLLLVVFLVSFHPSFSARIYGTVRGEDGKPLPFATIYVKQTNTGTTTNADGYYEINLSPGAYNLVFQYLGYESNNQAVTIGQEDVQLPVILKPQVVVLQNVEITASDEDPAYTIMRNAIAKSKYHLNQLDSFSSKVYLKGTGKLKNIPFLFRNRLKKEGIDTSRVFVTESISQVFYQRPRTYREKVISIRSSGDDNNTSPMAYINASFYSPKLANAISPLAPQAFSYYRFEYEGTFMDREYAVSKIRVIPRSQGEDVFSGILNIVEDDWSIHSLDFKVVKMGVDIHVNQIYAPVEEKVWLPVSHRFLIEGTFFGFNFEYRYLATISDYDIYLNPEIEPDIEVVDKQEITRQPDLEQIQDLEPNQQVSRRKLRRLMRKYEKQERQETGEPDVVYSHQQTVDTLAYRKDSSYWYSVRPVPLSEKEIEGYQQIDSIAQAELEQKQQDSLKQSKSASFNLFDLVTGHNFSLNKNNQIYIKPALSTLAFNTVEGVNFQYAFGFRHKRFSIGPSFRYAFAREKLLSQLTTNYTFGSYLNEGKISLAAGQGIRQYFQNSFNQQVPISPFLNTLMTLLLERNYMKIFQANFIRLNYGQTFKKKLDLDIFLDYSKRMYLPNQTDYNLVDRDKVTYTENAPANLELAETAFNKHQAFRTGIKISLRPWLKFRRINNQLYPIDESSPTFILGYRTGLKLANSIVDYDHLSLGLTHRLEFGVRGNLDFRAEFGDFLSSNNLFFMDYQHFMGNQTPFLLFPTLERFRLLDYYQYSTQKRYLQFHSNYQMRKFLFTRIPAIRLLGLRENLLINALSTNKVDHYLEIGYGLDYIFRVFRLELITSWENGDFKDFGIRVGLINQISF